MTYLVIAGILLVALYVGATIWVRWRDGSTDRNFAERLNAALPDSMSALVYELPQRWQWLWSVWMWAVAMLTCIPLIVVLPENAEALAFAMMASLSFCGAMPLSDRSVSRRVHNALGILGGVLSQLCVAVLSPWWLMAWWLWPFLMGGTFVEPSVIGMSAVFRGKGVFVAESICLLTACGSLLSSM